MRSTHEIIPKPIPLPNPEPHPRSNRRSLRKLRTAVVKRRRQRLKRRRRRSRAVVLRGPSTLASLGIAPRRRCSLRTERAKLARPTQDGLCREVAMACPLPPRRLNQCANRLARGKAAMLVADRASEALTTEDELRRERRGVQCEAQASLSALRRELPPTAPRVLLSSCGFCCSSTLCLGFRTCACTFDPQIRLLGW